MSDIVEKLRGFWGDVSNRDIIEAADEIERMRAALEKIAAIDEVWVTDFDNVKGWAHQRIAREALPKG